MNANMETYGREAASVIISDCCDGMVVFKENGVYPSDSCLEADTSQQFHWNFACDLEGPDVPDALVAPSLPIPFTPNELAVFMLDGVGAFVQFFYGEWESGPDEEKLKEMGIQARKPREALRGAYAAYREAQKVVGELDRNLEVRANRLAAIYRKKNEKANRIEGVFAPNISTEEKSNRRNRAKALNKKWRECSREAKGRFDDAFFAWRKMMVNQLIYQKENPANSNKLVHAAMSLDAKTIKPSNEWDSHNLNRLLDESREAGMTHEKLAKKYNVSRPRISKLLKEAKESFVAKKATPFDTLSKIGKK